MRASAGFMHIIVPFLQEVLSLVCPDKSMLAKWRREAAQSGFHEAISVPVPTTLDREVASELRGMDIEGLRLVDLQKLARILGVSASGRKAELKLSLAPLLQSINGFSFARTDTRTTHTTHTHTPSHTHRYWNCGSKCGLPSNTVGVHQGANRPRGLPM